jgi:hypothetical protein
MRTTNRSELLPSTAAENLPSSAEVGCPNRRVPLVVIETTNGMENGHVTDNL